MIENLTPQQIEYIKIKSDPETRAKKITEKQIAEQLGIGERQLYNWKKIPEIRAEITKQSMLSSVDELPTILKEVYTVATSQVGKDVTAAAKVSAIKLWLDCHGFLDKVDKDPDDDKDKPMSFEDRIIGLGNGIDKRMEVLD